MVTVRVSTQVPAARGRVWAVLERLEDHVEWMQDATAIRFRSAQRRGVGTTFECDTKVGPIRLTDAMEVTEWEEGTSIGVHHRGAVSGSGRFVLTDAPGPSTVVEWEEQLSFPWWLGASMGARVAKPLLGALWRGNLRRFARVVRTRTEVGPA
jgi:Polyketide cyclase / dehydrase and lipid transport